MYINITNNLSFVKQWGLEIPAQTNLHKPNVVLLNWQKAKHQTKKIKLSDGTWSYKQLVKNLESIKSQIYKDKVISAFIKYKLRNCF